MGQDSFDLSSILRRKFQDKGLFLPSGKDAKPGPGGPPVDDSRLLIPGDGSGQAYFPEAKIKNVKVEIPETTKTAPPCTYEVPSNVAFSHKKERDLNDCPEDRYGDARRAKPRRLQAPGET